MAKITLRPITCYKVFKVENYIVKTPFMDMHITMSNLIFGMRCKKMCKKVKQSDNWIREGIHACTTIEAAEEQSYLLQYEHKHMKFTKDAEFIIVEMIIPAFTWYWIGYHEEICAQRMIFSESAKTVISNISCLYENH